MSTDDDLIACYEAAKASWAAADAIVRADGVTCASPTGRLAPHPATLVRAAASREMRALAGEVRRIRGEGGDSTSW
jgi:phage terminase small subunit